MSLHDPDKNYDVILIDTSIFDVIKKGVMYIVMFKAYAIVWPCLDL